MVQTMNFWFLSMFQTTHSLVFKRCKMDLVPENKELPTEIAIWIGNMMKTDGIWVSPVSPNIFIAKWHVWGLEDIGARHLCLQTLHTCIQSGLSETNPKCNYLSWLLIFKNWVATNISVINFPCFPNKIHPPWVKLSYFRPCYAKCTVFAAFGRIYHGRIEVADGIFHSLQLLGYLTQEQAYKTVAPCCSSIPLSLLGSIWSFMGTLVQHLNKSFGDQSQAEVPWPSLSIEP